MNKHPLNLVTACFLFLFICGKNLSAYAQSSKVENWKEDIRYLVDELEIRHANLYHTITQTAFKDSMDQLLSRLHELKEDQIIVELAKLTALIGDGHTGLFLPWGRGFDYSELPLELYYGDDGYFVLAARSDYKSIVGNRLLEINDVPVNTVQEKIVPLLPRDNEYVLESFAGRYMRLYELLVTLNIADSSKNEVVLTLENDEGNQQKVIVQAYPKNDPVKWHFITEKSELPLYLKNREEQYWFDYLQDDRIVFLQFNSADISSGTPEAKFAAFTDSLVTFIDNRDVEKLVIDLRWNSGGSFTRTRHLLWAVIRSEKIDTQGKLFTIIGPGTFSAATALATELDMHTQTLFAGEPSGGEPNSYGDLGRITLPNSKTEVWYSRWDMNQSLPGDHRPAIFPDLKAHISLQDYVNGRDPVLETIRSYQPKKPVSEVIQERIEADGIEAAVEEYWNLRNEKFNSYDFGEEQLNTLGYELLNQTKIREAVQLFLINKEVFPYSPNSYDSLGDAYRAAGEYEKAIQNFQKAFQIDKQYSHSRDKAQELIQK